MNYAIDTIDKVTITIKVENGRFTISNGRGVVFGEDKMTADTLILSMLYQTLHSQLKAWENVSDNFKIELHIHEEID